MQVITEAVIPAKAGIQSSSDNPKVMKSLAYLDSRLRRNYDFVSYALASFQCEAKGSGELEYVAIGSPQVGGQGATVSGVRSAGEYAGHSVPPR